MQTGPLLIREHPEIFWGVVASMYGADDAPRRAHLGQIGYGRGDLHAALAALTRNIALRLLGEIASTSESDDPSTALAHYRQAMTLAEELGMRPLAAHCHLGLGRLYDRRGKRQETQEHLTTAMAMYRDMDMRYWLETAEAAAP